MTWMRKSKFIRNFGMYFFLIAALLIVPGNTTGVFNGLPLSSIPELSGFLILLFGIFSSKFKSNFKQVSAKISPRYLVAFILIFGIAIPAKFALKHSDLPTGRFDACYHSYVRSDDMKVPECEPFFSAKFEGGRSRLDERVNFQGLNYPLRDINVSGSNWNLSFINNEQFLGRYGNYEQVRHPFRANWVGKFSVSEDNGFIPVTYVGYGSITIDSSITRLPAHYGSPRTEWVAVSKGIHSININYSFTALQMKPVNGVDYSLYGYYATLKIGEPQSSPNSLPNVVSGWAVNPDDFQRFQRILYVSGDGGNQEIEQSISRTDVISYLENESSNSFIGFSASNVPPSANSKIVGISAAGTRPVLVYGDGQKWIEEPSISNEKLWYRIDDSFDSAERFKALEPLSAGQGSGFLISAIDYLIGISLIGVIGLFATSFRRFWTTYVLLGCGIFTHLALLDSKLGWGYDGVEGSAVLYTSALVAFVVLSYAIFRKPGSFVSAGLLAALYVSVDRVIHVNPGMRYDYFLPITGNSPASNLGAVFFRPVATDWLLHASNTRSALFRGLLFGNEPVFYLQPGYRYFAPIFQYLFGDGDVRLSIAVMFSTLAGMVFLLGVVVKSAMTLVGKFGATVFLAGTLLLATSWVMSYFILVQTTEIPTWPFMLFGSYLIFGFRVSRVGIVLPGVLFGLAVCMRPNQIIGHVFLLFALSLFADQEIQHKKKFVRLFQRFAAMGLVSSLPLVHNLYFGKRFVLFSTSRAGGSFDIAEAPDHVWRYLYVFFRPLRSADLTSQGIMGLPGDSGFSRPLILALVIFLIAWLLSIAQFFKTKPALGIGVLLLTPVVYLLPVIPYHAYFPRHAIVFWLSMFVVAVAHRSFLNTKLTVKRNSFEN
jgi:hypothetical protein